MSVCDSGPLIYLARTGQIGLLRRLFDSVAIPASVYRETVEEARSLKKPGVLAIEDAVKEGWIEVVRFSSSDMESIRRLSERESIQIEDAEVLFLAKRRSTKLVTNDKWLMKVARTLRIEAIWTTTLILLAVKKKVLNRSEGRDLLRQFSLSGLYLRSDAYEGILEALEEL